MNKKISEIKKNIGSVPQALYFHKNKEKDKLDWLLHSLYELSVHHHRHYGMGTNERILHEFLLNSKDLNERLKKIENVNKEFKQINFYNLSGKLKKKKIEKQNPGIFDFSEKDIQKYKKAFTKRFEIGKKYLSEQTKNKKSIYYSTRPIKTNFPYNEKIQELEKYFKKMEPNLDDKKNKLSHLEKSLAVLSIGSVLAGIFFLSPNLTGNVIGNVAKSSGDILGGILFILGIVGAFFTLRK